MRTFQKVDQLRIIELNILVKKSQSKSPSNEQTEAMNEFIVTQEIKNNPKRGKNQPLLAHSTGFHRAPYQTEINALKRRQAKMIEKLDKKMEVYESKNKKTWNNKGNKNIKEQIRIKQEKKPNYGYFDNDQWRYSNVKCKEHEWKIVRQRDKITRQNNCLYYFPSRFGRNIMNNDMRYISNKIRKLIVRF
ncbi:unnamed protein product [Paramecium sonneborni]|uniref:Uncharacterized protein n=1 Tax=Paramecium sonneborni TaxID=65129 RepID=A0A8S1M1S5_9CILI|nr:unnamed protein product [Paramecium sonneborni]